MDQSFTVLLGDSPFLIETRRVTADMECVRFPRDIAASWNNTQFQLSLIVTAFSPGYIAGALLSDDPPAHGCRFASFFSVVSPAY